MLSWKLAVKPFNVKRCENVIVRVKSSNKSIPKKKLIFFFKLHFIILNYILDYTLYHKLFKCTIYTLNQDIYYTLHLNVSFTVILDEIFMYMTRPCVFFRWDKVKREKHYSSQSIKQEASFILFFSSSLSLVQVQPSPQIKTL